MGRPGAAPWLLPLPAAAEKSLGEMDFQESMPAPFPSLSLPGTMPMESCPGLCQFEVLGQALEQLGVETLFQACDGFAHGRFRKTEAPGSRTEASRVGSGNKDIDTSEAT